MDYCVEELTKGWFILLNLVLSPQSREREREREVVQEELDNR